MSDWFALREGPEAVMTVVVPIQHAQASHAPSGK
jgi:hypothetical protein